MKLRLRAQATKIIKPLKLVAIPLSRDETATAWCDPLPYDEATQDAAWEAGQLFTPEQREIVFRENGDASMTDEEFDALFDTLAIVKETDLPKLSRWSDRALNGPGSSDDSGLYENCAEYVEKVLNIAVTSYGFE